jgi:hypothetical protein
MGRSLLRTAGAQSALFEQTRRPKLFLVPDSWKICSGRRAPTSAATIWDNLAAGSGRGVRCVCRCRTETAAASHLAALLGVNGQSYTLVGDSSVGLGAIHFATELLTIQPRLDRCLVVGTEEADWLLADAFASWRMATNRHQFEVYGRSGGTIFGEGAAAVLIGRTGSLAVTNSSAGLPFRSFRESESAAREIMGGLRTEGLPEMIISSANGTFADEVERRVFSEYYPSVPVFTPKPAVGEALGASALFQVAVAGLALRHQLLPGTLAAGTKLPSVNRETRSVLASKALVTSVGFNHQVNALKLCLTQSPY